MSVQNNTWSPKSREVPALPPLYSLRHWIPTSTPAEDHTYYNRKDVILQAPQHTPTSLYITPTKEANPVTATPSLLQQPVRPTTVSHI
jgi:hypothetical protein